MKRVANALSLVAGLMAISFVAPGCSARDAKGEQQDSRQVARDGAVSMIADMATRRAAHTATLLDNGKVLIVGGFPGDQSGLSSTELFDPATAGFGPGPVMGEARSGHTATRLPDGKVLVAGGYNGDYLSSTEIYDPATNRFEPIEPMTMARSGHTATLLTNGKVLVVGGHRGRRPSVTVYASAEIYDPAAGTFTPAGTMTRIRHKHEAVLLQDGRVLIAGGSDERDGRGAYVSAEIYDPRTGKFTATGDMNAARYKLQGTSVLLKDGKVLFAGGSDKAEIFDPATNTFSYVPGSLGTNRFFATATLLRNGHVLITGGYNDSNAASAHAWEYRSSS